MVYITGDTHADIGDYRWAWLNDNLSSNDILIITGDFGFDWNEDIIRNWKSMNRKYTTLFCDGNHENYDVLNSLPIVEKYGSEVGMFCEDTFRLLTGHMYLIEGEKYFVFGGASSIDRTWRLMQESRANSYRTLWWQEEVPSESSFNEAKKTLAENNYTFDYFITHTCNSQLKSLVLQGCDENFFDPVESMINSLEYLIKENGGDWKASYFGHFHTNVNVEKYHCLYEDIIIDPKKNIVKKFENCYN